MENEKMVAALRGPKGKRVVGETENGKYWLTNFGTGSWPKDKPLPKDVRR